VYFNVGPIGDDQLADWARRNALDTADAERALAPLRG
jgi:5-methyltetrahydrofolate--homocysteine methyltransferase